MRSRQKSRNVLVDRTYSSMEAVRERVYMYILWITWTAYPYCEEQSLRGTICVGGSAEDAPPIHFDVSALGRLGSCELLRGRFMRQEAAAAATPHHLDPPPFYLEHLRGHRTKTGLGLPSTLRPSPRLHCPDALLPGGSPDCTKFAPSLRSSS